MESEHGGLRFVMEPEVANGKAVRVDYNQFGFRDRDFVKKADGVFRIIVAGDSYTYGHGLPERLAWPRQLESLLRQKFPDKQIEVYNFGFYGENLDVLDPLMQYALDEWEPDLLIYGYFLNDPEDDYTPNPVFNRTMDPARKGVAQAPGFLGLGETKMHTLRCLALVERFIQERKLAAATVAWYRSMHQGETWRNAAQRITAVKTLADAKKRRFMIVLLPLILHVNGQYPLTGAHDRVKELARAQGIEFLDVLPCLAKYRDSDLYRHPRDRHPNSLYTRIVAEAVAEAVFPRKEDRAGSGAGRGKALGSAVPAPKPEP